MFSLSSYMSMYFCIHGNVLYVVFCRSLLGNVLYVVFCRSLMGNVLYGVL
jgi:hypothetical protein